MSLGSLRAAAFAAVALLLPALGCPAPQPGGGDAGAGEPAAVVDGRTITLAELDARIKDDLFAQATGDGDPAQLYEVRSNTLDTMLDEAVLEEAARKAGKDAETLLGEAEAEGGEVSHAEVTAFYERIRDRLGENVTLEDVADQIRARLEGQGEAAARERYVASLREAADVEVAIEPPRIEVDATGPSLGPDDAPVTIVEFSDYQCPFCKRAEPTVKALAERYPEQVRIVYRHFPLDSIHPLARGAAEAAACADAQGRFWEYHALVWEATPDLSPEKLEELAATAELDVDAFRECVAEDRYGELVERDATAGQEAGVNGTPAFFVNGIPISGAQPLERFVEMVEAELAREDAPGEGEG